MSTAYLMARVDIKTLKLTFAFITPEKNQTTCFSREHYMVVLEVDGKTFADARDSIIGLIPQYYPWIMPLMPK